MAGSCLAGGANQIDVQLRETKKTFAKRAVLQLECIPEINLLLSLTGARSW
jgi:hypothetical protein